MSTVVEQIDDRAEWLESRKSAIGASDLAGVLGISPWSSPWEVWAEKMGKLDPWSGNRSTRAGVAFERAVLDDAENALGRLSRNVRVVADGIPLASTCDAIVEASNRPVEAKTTGIVGPVFGQWGDALTDEIPEYYLTQVHAQLICTKAEIGYLFALIAGRGVVEYHVEANEQLHNLLKSRVSDWWERHIIGGEAPSLEVMPALDVVKRMKKQPNKTVELSADVLQLVEQRETLKASEKSTKAELEAVETKILLALGDAECGTLPDDRQLTYLSTSRKGYTVEPTTYRTLRIKKGK